MALIILETVCSGIAVARPLDPIPPESRDQRLRELEHVPWLGPAQERQVGSEGGCTESALALNVGDPRTGEKTRLQVSLLSPGGNQRHPLIIVVPTIEGVTPLEERIVSTLCEAGMASIIADVNDRNEPKDYPSWGHEDRVFRGAILKLRTLLDFAESDGRFDRDRLGIVGLSLGGITAALLAGVEPERLRATVVAVGAGNIPHVMSLSDNSHIVDLKRNRMRAAGLSTLEAYENQLRTSIAFDPIYFASRADRNRVLMVMAERDAKVPTVDQKQLFEAFGRPRSIKFPGGHVPTLVSLAYFQFGDVVEFLDDCFKQTSGRFERRLTEAAR
jgi:dienelactone hydrolase